MKVRSRFDHRVPSCSSRLQNTEGFFVHTEKTAVGDGSNDIGLYRQLWATKRKALHFCVLEFRIQHQGYI